MPIPISTAALREKNKVSSDGAFLLLLEVRYSASEDPVRLVWNNEDVVWDGQTWRGCPFELGELSETKESELPSVDLTVLDIERNLIPHLEEYAAGIGATVWIRIVNSNLLDEAAMREETFEIMDVSVTGGYRVTFKLGAENLSEHRSPRGRFLKSHCRYKVFKGSHCGYDGSETECDRTFTRCKELGNESRFGGFPGVGQQGVWK